MINDMIREHVCQAFIVLIFLAIPALLLAFDGNDIHHTRQTAFWVFFDEKSDEMLQPISQKAVDRRMSRAGSFDRTWYDFRIKSEYLAQLASDGARIRVISRWLDAASIEADSAVIARVAGYPFVTAIRPVPTYFMPLPNELPAEGEPRGKINAFDYGPSLVQVGMLAIDSLHNAGLSGRDILVGLMDTGFDTSHAAFRRLDDEHRIVATYDFINGDSNVMDLFDSQRFHGTATLSAAAGFDEGNLIGTAYGASYILAKTEIVNQEIMAEEDYWVAAAEWMESLGVDIISSSVGFTDWYDTTQLDGQTAVITQAANIANSLGVIVVNAAGNEGNTFWRKVIPPADGDSVIAVGAVDSEGNVVAFSSRGPTADGRIKPDVCALGSADYVANYAGGYGLFSGTSFSTPLIAGGIALLLEGHPDWTLSRVIGTLKRASSRAATPNNAFGWGIPNFVDAYHMQPYEPEGGSVITIIPHPAVDSVVFYLSIVQTGKAIFSLHDLSGTELEEWAIPVDEPTTVIQVWNGRNHSGNKVASGIYICNLKTGEGSVRQKFFFIAN